ncbi:response regulator transcription factor [Cytobacillus dafuensis]|uniref:Response regulator transcription factor n=1 Tax=Cytobacillus dafuensis TaxID=1742359 RepID=A0A5B8ZAC7_CYTDA|nr:response regulator transcription factor [Cytobacillus dafuensis]QED49881.1 response regulator transcription factor [Cytobacillus dafuensis]
MRAEKVLVVDDDQDIREVLNLYLNNEGYIVIMAESGEKALTLFEEHDFDLVLLDVMMPGMDGFETCQSIRKKSNIPILFLSAKEDDIDKILGLRIGGDDYITKPFSPAVLVAKIKALLRRARQSRFDNSEEQQTRENPILHFPDLTIDMEKCVVKRGREKVTLPAKEYQLLCVLARNAGRVYSVEQLFQLIWGEDSLGDNRTVMVHVSNLRKKIETEPAKPKYVQTVRGIGYKFNDAFE